MLIINDKKEYKMSRVVMSLPSLGVTGKGYERNKEIYVVSFATDLNPRTKPAIPDVVAAYNETLPNLVPDLAKQAALQFITVSVSNIFPRIRQDQPVSLSGSGIILYPPKDPQGLLALHLMVIECDESTRNIGEFLAKLLGENSVQSVVTSLLSTITQPLLATLMNAIIDQVPKALKKNRDDLYFAHSHAGFDFDNYANEYDKPYTDYLIGNDRVNCVLRSRVID